jgi:hypothetical protein
VIVVALSWPSLPCALKAAIGIAKRTLGHPASLPRAGAAARASAFRGSLDRLARRAGSGAGSGSWDRRLRRAILPR